MVAVRRGSHNGYTTLADQLSPRNWMNSKAIGRSGSWTRILGLVYIATTPLDSIVVLGRSLTFYLGAVFALMWTWDVYRGRRPQIPTSVVTVLALLFAWAALSTFWALNRSVAVQAAIGLLGLMIAALAICDIFGRDFRPALKALSLGTVMAAVPVLFSPPDASRRGQTTYLSIDENTLALHLVIGLAALLYLAVSAPTIRRRVLYLAGYTLVFVAILLIGSRTGLTASLVVTTLGLILSLRTLRGAATAFTLVAFAYIGFVWLRDMNRIPSRILDFIKDPEVTDGREIIIERYLETQNDWLIKGVGLFNDSTYLKATTGIGYNAHSAFWKSWIELGIVGLTLWFVLLGLVMWYGLRAPAWSFVVTAIAGMLPFWFSLGGLWSNDVWVVVGLAIAGYRFHLPIRLAKEGHTLHSKHIGPLTRNSLKDSHAAR